MANLTLTLFIIAYSKFGLKRQTCEFQEMEPHMFVEVFSREKAWQLKERTAFAPSHPSNCHYASLAFAKAPVRLRSENRSPSFFRAVFDHLETFRLVDIGRQRANVGKS